MTNRNTGLAFLFGAVSGGIVALLMAPDRGTNTRRRIREGAEHIYKQGNDALMEARDTAQEKVGEVAETAHQHMDAVKSAVEVGRKTYRNELAEADKRR